jgi:hypothetical protein
VTAKSNYEEPIPGGKLKAALSQATAGLGRSAQDAIFRDLELSGMDFKDGNYTLMQVQAAIRNIFGQDGTELLMRRIENALLNTT